MTITTQPLNSLRASNAMNAHSLLANNVGYSPIKIKKAKKPKTLIINAGKSKKAARKNAAAITNVVKAGAITIRSTKPLPMTTLASLSVPKARPAAAGARQPMKISLQSLQMIDKLAQQCLRGPVQRDLDDDLDGEVDSLYSSGGSASLSGSEDSLDDAGRITYDSLLALEHNYAKPPRKRIRMRTPSSPFVISSAAAEKLKSFVDITDDDFGYSSDSAAYGTERSQSPGICGIFSELHVAYRADMQASKGAWPKQQSKSCAQFTNELRAAAEDYERETVLSRCDQAALIRLERAVRERFSQIRSHCQVLPVLTNAEVERILACCY